MSDLSAAERLDAFTLVGAAIAWCDLATAGEFRSRDDVIAFPELERS